MQQLLLDPTLQFVEEDGYSEIIRLRFATIHTFPPFKLKFE